jgi:ABC-type Fe3+ transport system, permease component
MAVWGSFIKYWPYNLTLTWANYKFESFDANGWDSYINSLVMAAGAAVLGTTLTFTGAWLVEKTKGFYLLRDLVRLLAFLPMAVPGLVLGWATSSSSTRRQSAQLPLCHHGDPGDQHRGALSTRSGHLTATTALKQIDPEFEAVSAR